MKVEQIHTPSVEIVYVVPEQQQQHQEIQVTGVQKPGNRRIALPPVGKPKWSICGIGDHWQDSINSFTDWYWDRSGTRGLKNNNNLRLCYYQCCCVNNNKTSCNPWVRTCCTNICCHNETLGLYCSFPLFCPCLCFAACICGGRDTRYSADGQHGVCECCCDICPLDFVRALCHTPCLYCSRCFYTCCCCPTSPINSK